MAKKNKSTTYGHVEEIAKYNLENKTNFYTIDQVRQHQKDLQELAKLEADYDAHAEHWNVNPDAYSVTDAFKYSGSRPETLEDLYRLKGWKQDAKTTTLVALGALASVPLAGEFATYGALGGAARVGGGFLGSHLGSKGLGWVGNYADSKLGTDFLGTTGNVLGGFLGFGLGMGATGNIVDNIIKPEIANIKNRIIIHNAFKSGKLQFGKPTVYEGWHQSEQPIKEFKFPFNRWDVINHNADPNGAFFTIGKPASDGFLSKRRFSILFKIPSQKPLIQFGEIKGRGGSKNNIRNAIVKYGRKHGADAIEFRGIADNQLQNQDILFMTDKIKPSLIKIIDIKKQGGRLPKWLKR